MSPTPDRPQETSQSHRLDLALQAFLRAEILSLKGRLADRDEEVSALRHRLEARPIARLRAGLAISYLRLLMRCRPSLKNQVRMLEVSDLFDAHWYARCYPQCGGSAFAAIHYLRAGAFQGHDPGPYFNTSDYYRANPDVAAARAPALAHYLLNGHQEGRSLCPVPTQDATD